MLVRDTIRMKGPVARHEVAKITGLTPSAVTVIVNEFIEAGVIKEVGWGESSGGRRPVMLELNPQAGYIFVVRLQGGEILTALLDLSDGIISSNLTRTGQTRPEDVVRLVGEDFDTYLRDLGIKTENVLWCGVATPGLIDYATGTIERSTNLGWHRVPLRQMLSARLGGVPVCIENNSNAAALAEQRYGSGRGCTNLIYLNLSVGISGGIVIDGEIYGGAKGYAGEIGHMMLMPYAGTKCRCGRHGCFEAICGIGAILDRIRNEVSQETLASCGLTRDGLTIEDVIRPPLIEVPQVKQILTQTGRVIGLVVANLVHIFNPEMVILGGELPRAGRMFMDVIRREARDMATEKIMEAVKIVESSMVQDPQLRGAYAQALGNAFTLNHWGRRE